MAAKTSKTPVDCQAIFLSPLADIGRPTHAAPAELRSGSDSCGLVDAPVAQQRPDDAGHLGCQRHDRRVRMSPCEQPTQPLAKMRIALPQRRHRGSRTLDKRLAQVLAAPLSDAHELRAAARRDLSGHKAEPGGQIASAREGAHVADSCHQGSRVEGADAGNGGQSARIFVRAGLLGELGIERGDAPVEVLPTLVHLCHEGAHASAKIRIGLGLMQA